MSVSKILYHNVIWRGLYYLTLFLLNVLVARYFGAIISGSVYYVINIYSFVILFTGLGIESGITYFTANGEIDSRKLFSIALIWGVIISTVAFGFCYFFIQDKYQLPGNLLLFSVFTFLCGNLLLAYNTAFFYAKKNLIIPNGINILTNVILISLLLFGRFSNDGFITEENYFYVYFISFLIQGVILTAIVRLKYPKQICFGLLSFPELKILFNYCLMAYFSNLVFFFLYRIDFWFVKKYCSAIDLGNYIQVSKIGQLFFVLPTILAGAIFPLTAGGDKKIAKELISLLSRILLWLYIVVCSMLVLFGNSLFPSLFGSSFTKMYSSFLFLIPGILSLSMLFTLTAFFAGKNRISVNIFGALIALVFVILGDYFLIPKYGINAAALVSSIGYFVYLIFVLSVFVKEYNVSLSSFFVIKPADFKSLFKKLLNKNNLTNGA